MSRDTADTEASATEPKGSAALEGVPFPDKDWREGSNAQNRLGRTGERHDEASR